MIVLGVVLLIIGLFVSSILFWIGVGLILLGLFLEFGPRSGQHAGPRRRYW